MKRLRFRVAAALLVAAAAIGAWTVSAYADAAPNTIVEQDFAADSGDRCQYGVTRGKIFWTLGPLVRPPAPVGVKGALVDRPHGATPPDCGDDRRFSVVTITAYTRDVVVDQEQVRADNGVSEIQLRLTNETSTAQIDRLVIVVCRHPIDLGIPGFCGPRQEYRKPIN